MSIKDFDRKFGIISNLETEKQKFVTRVEGFIFSAIPKDTDAVRYNALVRQICYYYGISYSEFQKSWNPNNSNSVPPLYHITKHDFIQTLKILTILLHYDVFNPDYKDKIEVVIKGILEQSSVELGIEFSNKEFYPTGEKLLDIELINYSLQVLENYPEQNKHLKNALKDYAAKDFENTLQDCYLVLEGLAQKILNNTRNLDNNKEDLLKFLGFSNEWKAILATFIKYFNEYGRHTKGNERSINEYEVEACLYQTCLFVRAMIKSIT
jgi:hypothetical protein